MNKVKSTILTLVALVGIVSVAVPVVSPQVVDAQSKSAADSIKEGIDKTGGQDNKTSLEDNIKIITNILLFIIGAIAVIMIIIGGIRYVTSNGDANQTKAAKDTILYAVVGIIVAILAFAIVNFVIGAFVK